GRTTVLAKGKLATLDNQIDPTTGTVKLKASFDNADEALFPNQFVNVELVVDTMRGATILPSAAVQRGAMGSFVYLANADSTVSAKAVKVLRTDGDRVAIEPGEVAAGARVVIDGADRLKDGGKVVLPEAQGQRPGGRQGQGAPGAGAPG